MKIISISYSMKWQHKEHNHYQWTTCGKLINTKTGRFIKKTVNGRSVGYWIKGKFITLNNLRNQLELIPEDYYKLLNYKKHYERQTNKQTEIDLVDTDIISNLHNL